jgi:hypothetical protein
MYVTAPAITIELTDASPNVLTCDSTAQLYVGQNGWAVKSDNTGSLRVVISKIFDTTTFLCQSYANRRNSGGADLTAYSGGNIYIEEQLVAVQQCLTPQKILQ